MKFSEHEETAKEYGIGGGGFWRPQKGISKVRILSEYEAYGFHWDNKKKKGGRCIGKDEGCIFCKEGDNPKAKFLMWVIDREDNVIKIAQIGYTVIQQIAELQVSDDWGFSVVPDYDITINRKGEGIDTKYFVQPASTKTKLTTAEKKAVDETTKDLKEIIERMKEKMGGSSVQVDEEPEEEDTEDEVKDSDIPF